MMAADQVQYYFQLAQSHAVQMQQQQQPQQTQQPHPQSQQHLPSQSSQQHVVSVPTTLHNTLQSVTPNMPMVRL